MLKRILLFVLGPFVLVQFIQPDRSVPPIDPAKDMLAITQAPADIQQLVVGACYDCHSYRTNYPWYGRLTPVNFIMQDHITEGREVLNFSLWDRYAGSEAAGENAETIQEGKMPPDYYRSMHGHGDLNAAQRQRLIAWFNSVPGAEGSSDAASSKVGEEEEEDD